MIAYFPTPYPDELWYSVCARFSDRMAFGTETGVMQALYGRRHAVATVDLPHRLEAVTSQLPISHPCDADTVIDALTFLPYYSPFLDTVTYQTVRRFMIDGTKSSVRIRCGACTHRVRPPKYFRSCPKCDANNHRRHGEPYWRRLFQLPGVEVCPIHKVFLEPSNIRLDPLPNRHKYFSAKTARLEKVPHSIQLKDPKHQILLNFANDIEWLLQQRLLNPGLKALHKRYRETLNLKGFITRAGSIRMADLKTLLVRFYGEDLLHLLQSSLPNENRDGWLGHLLRKSNTAMAPLRHLLLLRALDLPLQNFFHPEPTTTSHVATPQPTGPWPCRNPVCTQFQNPFIQKPHARVVDTNGEPHVHLKCPACGFAYRVSENTNLSPGCFRILDYGPVWHARLKSLWTDPQVTLRKMARILGVDPKTIKQRAMDQALPFPRAGKRPVTTRGLYVPVGGNRSQQLKEHRESWLVICRTNDWSYYFQRVLSRSATSFSTNSPRTAGTAGT